MLELQATIYLEANQAFWEKSDYQTNVQDKSSQGPPIWERSKIISDAKANRP